jgi:hypothetical protein
MSDLVHELDHRNRDGIDVRLLWSRRDGRVLVTVADERSGERFTIEVPEGERALEVFHHPYAFAARPGVRTLYVDFDVPARG